MLSIKIASAEHGKQGAGSAGAEPVVTMTSGQVRTTIQKICQAAGERHPVLARRVAEMHGSGDPAPHRPNRAGHWRT
ncbi:MAG: hypothetical protein R3E70_15565 [Burkholderiaceae bacterium]